MLYIMYFILKIIIKCICTSIISHKSNPAVSLFFDRLKSTIRQIMALPVDLFPTQEMRRWVGTVCLGVRVAQVIQLRANQGEFYHGQLGYSSAESWQIHLWRRASFVPWCREFESVVRDKHFDLCHRGSRARVHKQILNWTRRLAAK